MATTLGIGGVPPLTIGGGGGATSPRAGGGGKPARHGGGFGSGFSPTGGLPGESAAIVFGGGDQVSQFVHAMIGGIDAPDTEGATPEGLMGQPITQGLFEAPIKNALDSALTGAALATVPTPYTVGVMNFIQNTDAYKAVRDFMYNIGADAAAHGLQGAVDFAALGIDVLQAIVAGDSTTDTGIDIPEGLMADFSQMTEGLSGLGELGGFETGIAGGFAGVSPSGQDVQDVLTQFSSMDPNELLANAPPVYFGPNQDIVFKGKTSGEALAELAAMEPIDQENTFKALRADLRPGRPILHGPDYIAAQLGSLENMGRDPLYNGLSILDLPREFVEEHEDLLKQQQAFIGPNQGPNQAARFTGLEDLDARFGGETPFVGSEAAQTMDRSAVMQATRFTPPGQGLGFAEGEGPTPIPPPIPGGDPDAGGSVFTDPGGGPVPIPPPTIGGESQLGLATSQPSSFSQTTSAGSPTGTSGAIGMGFFDDLLDAAGSFTPVGGGTALSGGGLGFAEFGGTIDDMLGTGAQPGGGIGDIISGIPSSGGILNPGASVDDIFGVGTTPDLGGVFSGSDDGGFLSTILGGLGSTARGVGGVLGSGIDAILGTGNTAGLPGGGPGTGGGTGGGTGTPAPLDRLLQLGVLLAGAGAASGGGTTSGGTTTTNINIPPPTEAELELLGINTELARQQLEAFISSVNTSNQQQEQVQGILDQFAAEQAALDAVISPEDRAALARQQFDFAQAQGPIEQEILERQLAAIQQGNRATPEQLANIGAATDAAIALGTGDLSESLRSEFETIRNPLAASLGLRATDSPITERLDRAAVERERQRGQLVTALRGSQAEANLNFPLAANQVANQAAFNQQNILAQRANTQAALANEAFQNRARLAESAGTLGLGLSTAFNPTGLLNTLGNQRLAGAGKFGSTTSTPSRFDTFNQFLGGLGAFA